MRETEGRCKELSFHWSLKNLSTYIISLIVWKMPNPRSPLRGSADFILVWSLTLENQCTYNILYVHCRKLWSILWISNFLHFSYSCTFVSYKWRKWRDNKHRTVSLKKKMTGNYVTSRSRDFLYIRMCSSKIPDVTWKIWRLIFYPSLNYKQSTFIR